MEVSFRLAKYDDLEKLIALCNECFEENTNIEYARRLFKETENDPNQIYLIGLIGEEIIAHTKITVIPTIYEEMNTYAILNHVCVKPSYRRNNIATKMLNECAKICKERKCVSMKLWSNNFREAAHAFYKNYGFIVNDAKFFSKDFDRSVL